MIHSQCIHWHNIDTVLLDMDGTLLDLAFDNFFWQQFVPQQYATIHQIPEDQAHQLIKQWIDRHHGTLNWYCLDFWTGELGLEIATLKRQVADRIAFRPGAQQFLDALKKSGRNIIMVTNAHPDALSLKVEKTGIHRYFHELVSSHSFGAAKEDQHFWQQLQNAHPFDPGRTLLVDDSLPVLTSAQRYGIGHLWSIRHPDSTQPPRAHTDPFPFIDSFDSVLP